jgi:hypothetical protein
MSMGKKDFKIITSDTKDLKISPVTKDISLKNVKKQKHVVLPHEKKK